MALNVLPSRSFPLGATVSPEGGNFCVYLSTPSELELLLFDSVSDTVKASHQIVGGLIFEIPLTPEDVGDVDHAPLISQPAYTVMARSRAVLMSC